jgi:hypothetical protein
VDQKLLEKHEALVVEMGNLYLDNMEIELGKKYQNNTHEVNASLTDGQYTELKSKHNIPNNEFADLYSEFQKMAPTSHLKQAMDAFTASGGNVDIEPVYDENTQRLNVSISYVIKDKTFEKIEGLTPLEDVILRMNALLQVETTLSGSDPDMSPSF